MENGGGLGVLGRARAAAWRRDLIGFRGGKDAAGSGVYIGAAGDRIPHEPERIWTPIRSQFLRFVRLEVEDDLLTSA